MWCIFVSFFTCYKKKSESTTFSEGQKPYDHWGSRDEGWMSNLSLQGVMDKKVRHQ